MANQPDPPQGEGQTNWFQDWSARTPIVSRSLLIAIVGGALLAFLAGIADVFSNVPVLVLGSFQVWRLFTYPLFESSFFTLLFTLLSFSTQGPKLELRMGSAAMAASVAALTVLAGLAYILFAVVLAFNPLVPMPDYLQTGSSGFWPILIGLITLDCWAQPEGTRRLLCFPCQIANRYFPLAFIGLFAVIGGGVPFDLLAGFAVAAVMSTSRAPFPCAVPTDAIAAPAGGMTDKEAARQARLAAMGGAPAAAPASASGIRDNVGVLEAMGFDAERARDALVACDGDVSRAAALLTQSAV